MDAIILAGGRGSRLHSVVSDVPKPMAPVKDRPFMEYILNWLAGYSVSRFIISVGYKSNIIMDYFKHRYNNLPVIYAIEQSPLGTGGAIKYALDFAEGPDVLIVNADTYFPVNVDELLEYHRKEDSELSIALKRMQHFDRYGTVELENGSINKFSEKMYCKEGLINGGIYVVNSEFVQKMQLPRVFSFEKNVLEELAGTKKIRGFVFEEPFIDIGVPEDYYKAGDFV